MMDKKRIALWDNLKFILIVSVVIGHFINIRDSVTYHSIFIFIYSFHMPLFFMYLLANSSHGGNCVSPVAKAHRRQLRLAVAICTLFYLLTIIRCPSRIRSDLRWFHFFRFATEVWYFRAILDSVSPFLILWYLTVDC